MRLAVSLYRNSYITNTEVTLLLVHEASEEIVLARTSLKFLKMLEAIINAAIFTSKGVGCWEPKECFHLYAYFLHSFTFSRIFSPLLFILSFPFLFFSHSPTSFPLQSFYSSLNPFICSFFHTFHFVSSFSNSPLFTPLHPHFTLFLPPSIFPSFTILTFFPFFNLYHHTFSFYLSFHSCASYPSIHPFSFSLFSPFTLLCLFVPLFNLSFSLLLPSN